MPSWCERLEGAGGPAIAAAHMLREASSAAELAEGASNCCAARLREDEGTLRIDASHQSHSPNTNSTVAFDSVFISGERASLARATPPMPEAMAIYCLPSTM